MVDTTQASMDCGGQDKSNTSPPVTSCVPVPKQILLPTKYSPSTPPSSLSSCKCHYLKRSLRSTGLLSANSQPWASTTSYGPANMPSPVAMPRTMTLQASPFASIMLLSFSPMANFTPHTYSTPAVSVAAMTLSSPPCAWLC